MKDDYKGCGCLFGVLMILLFPFMVLKELLKLSK
jgi:hypothetical protein